MIASNHLPVLLTGMSEGRVHRAQSQKGDIVQDPFANKGAVLVKHLEELATRGEL